MDVFSLGCVLAELFLEFPLFDFPSLLRYRAGDNDPLEPIYSKISNPDIRDLIIHMLNRDPSKRHSPGLYKEIIFIVSNIRQIQNQFSKFFSLIF